MVLLPNAEMGHIAIVGIEGGLAHIMVEWRFGTNSNERNESTVMPG